MPSVWSRSPPSAGDPRRPRHKRILGIATLMRMSALHSVGDEVSAGAFDDAGGEGPAVGQGGGVVEVAGLVGQVSRGVVGAFARGLGQASVGGGASDGAGDAGGSSGQYGPGLVVDPGFDVAVAFVVVAPGGLPQILEHVDHVDEDEHVGVTGLGFGFDPVELVVGAVNESDPTAGVGGVASLGLVEDLGYHGRGVIDDAGGQPLVGGTRSGADPFTFGVGGGQDVGDGARHGRGVVDRAGPSATNKWLTASVVD